ncbi:MAG TPA: type II secretion system F family protein [Nitrospirae bacterium]|nr:type II secretion system protein F [bacterium BMS3Abin06]HDH12116.1 type II secretion system F family protein [Nitrospirota bacterium]HDZ02378.1 type II secretion system F family protein [Nitrospirota bacterium]
MATVFKWSGKSTKGTVVKGELTAASKEEVQSFLRKQRIIPVKISQKAKPLFNLPAGRVKDKDLVVFTRQFATMIGAGLPLVQALEILSKQTENKTFAKIIGDIKSDVEGGSTFADALKKHPRIFSELYTNMVAAGEAGGILDTILVRLASYIEKAQSLKRKVKGAMVYPSVVISVAILVIVVIMVFVVPTFSQMFIQLGGTLPLPTQIVINISHFLGGVGGLITAASLIGFVVFIVQFRRTERGKKVTDTILLKFPIVGVLFKKVAVAKFTRTLGTLISSGVPILDGLNITAKTAGNKVVEKAVLGVRQGVSEGKTIAEPLSEFKVFPPMVTQMIAVGESTGALDNMLDKIADFYDDEVDNAVSNLTSMIEPVLMVFLGGSIGFIVVAMYLPIFKMITLID